MNSVPLELYFDILEGSPDKKEGSEHAFFTNMLSLRSTSKVFLAKVDVLCFDFLVLKNSKLVLQNEFRALRSNERRNLIPIHDIYLKSISVSFFEKLFSRKNSLSEKKSDADKTLPESLVGTHKPMLDLKKTKVGLEVLLKNPTGAVELWTFFHGGKRLMLTDLAMHTEKEMLLVWPLDITDKILVVRATDWLAIACNDCPESEAPQNIFLVNLEWKTYNEYFTFEFFEDIRQLWFERGALFVLTTKLLCYVQDEKKRWVLNPIPIA